LIHSDVCEHTLESIFGVKWFVTYVDHCEILENGILEVIEV